MAEELGIEFHKKTKEEIVNSILNLNVPVYLEGSPLDTPHFTQVQYTLWIRHYYLICLSRRLSVLWSIERYTVDQWKCGMLLYKKLYMRPAQIMLKVGLLKFGRRQRNLGLKYIINTIQHINIPYMTQINHRK